MVVGRFGRRQTRLCLAGSLTAEAGFRWRKSDEAGRRRVAPLVQVLSADAEVSHLHLRPVRSSDKLRPTGAG
jgi:hypothetical protein